MRRLLTLLATALALAPAAEAGSWVVTVAASGDLPNGAGRWWTLDAKRDGPAVARVVAVAPDAARSRLELVAGNGAEPRAERDALVLPGTLALLNAGYFDQEKRPVGWRAVTGVVSGTVADDAACTGFAWVDGDGLLRLTRRADGAPANAVWGVQAGPFLIDPGGAHGIARAAGPAARRSVIALTKDGAPLLIAVDHPLTLAAMADLLLALPAALGLPAVDAALNLDGGPSTALAVPSAEVAIAAKGPVIDAWRVVGRAP